MPSNIGARALLSYEHGHRTMTVGRFVEICLVFEEDPPTLLARALQRAHLHANCLVLRVDLKELLRERHPRFPPLRTWATNRLKDAPEGIVELPPLAVRELAAFLSIEAAELADYLAGFLPEPVQRDGRKPARS